MRMRALTSWYNSDHEGQVQSGDYFDATPYRARELERLSLAVPALSDTEKVVVRADPPPVSPMKARRQSSRS
jgi:hypothetical protein